MLAIDGFNILVFCCYKLHRNINVQNHLCAALFITQGYIPRSRITLLVILISLTQGSFLFFERINIPLAFLKGQTFISYVY